MKVEGLEKAIASIKGKYDNIDQDVQDELNNWADETALDAKQYAPKDMGQLAGSIHPSYGTMEAEVTVSVVHAAWVEFGTGKFASAYLSNLDQEWRDFARQFYINGKGRTPPKHYLYPAVIKNNIKLVANLKNLFK